VAMPVFHGLSAQIRAVRFVGRRLLAGRLAAANGCGKLT